MDQASNTIRKLTADQLQELKALVAKAGYELRPIKAPQTKKVYRFKTKFYRYNGISAAEAVGPTLIRVGQLCPSLLWPADIHAYYNALLQSEAA